MRLPAWQRFLTWLLLLAVIGALALLQTRAWVAEDPASGDFPIDTDSDGIIEEADRFVAIIEPEDEPVPMPVLHPEVVIPNPKAWSHHGAASKAVEDLDGPESEEAVRIDIQEVPPEAREAIQELQEASIEQEVTHELLIELEKPRAARRDLKTIRKDVSQKYKKAK